MDDMEELHRAFCRDDVAAIRKALVSRAELRNLINEPIGAFDSPAILSVQSRAMLDLLLEFGADINAKSKWWAGGFSLLETVKDELAEHAISRGAIVGVHAAARLGKMDRLRKLIESNPSLVNSRGGDGKMPLHFARNVEVAKYLLAKGAQIDARDIDHESTPAQHLIGEHPEVARFLVEQGAGADIFLAAALGNLELARKLVEVDENCLRGRVNKETFPMKNARAGGTIYIWTLGSNLSPQQVAKKFGHENVFQFLMEKSSPELRLVNWCWLGETGEAQKIAREDPRVISKISGPDRRAPVDAARENNTEASLAMLEIGLPMDERGQHGGTPLHWAAWHGNAALVKALLERGAAKWIETPDNDFKATPLGWASHGAQNCWDRNRGNHHEVETLLKAMT